MVTLKCHLRAFSFWCLSIKNLSSSLEFVTFHSSKILQIWKIPQKNFYLLTPLEFSIQIKLSFSFRLIFIKYKIYIYFNKKGFHFVIRREVNFTWGFVAPGNESSVTLSSLGTCSIPDLTFVWHSLTLLENVADNLSSDVRQANVNSIFPVEGIRQRIIFSKEACVPKKETKGKMKGPGWQMFGYNRLPIRRLFLSRRHCVF